ncbi:MAG: hypothetical protein KDD52_06800 [Bdellovibrionales bacterium]|nr:hypothetical protein [Bdellovibrionales bacterium]
MITSPEAAQRLARAIASDLSLYNKDKIIQGIEEDNFFELLANEIEEGRAHYMKKVDPSIVENTNFFDLALVDIILARSADVKSKIW